jgi:GT2 family glycosyltransferase
MITFVSINRGYGGAEKLFDRLYSDFYLNYIDKSQLRYVRHDSIALFSLKAIRSLMCIRRNTVVLNMSVLGIGILYLIILKLFGNVVILYLSGCFMLFRQRALLDVGVFDERFFMYPEDIDLTRRMAVKYDTLFFPDSRVYHEHGAASYKSFRMLLIHSFNIIKYFNKWGWVYDPIRSKLNKRTISQFKSL